MNLKKSVFSYIILAAFAVLCGVGIILSLGTAHIMEIPEWSFPGMAGVACGYLLLTTLVFFACRMLGVMIGEYIEDTKRLEKVSSIVFPILILIGAAVYLVVYMLSHTPLTLSDDSFYKLAAVTAGESVPFAVHGASWLYTCILHVLFLLFGNIPFIGVVMQITLFFVCLLLLYISMQAFAGVTPAVISMAAFGFLPVSIQYVFSLTPELFYLLFYLFGFCLIGILFQKFRKGHYSSSTPYIYVSLLGIYIGFLVYLDMYSVSLYFFFALLYSLDKENIKQVVLMNLTALVGSVIGFVLSVLVVSRIGKVSVSIYLRELFLIYKQNAGFDLTLDGNIAVAPDTTLIGSLVLICFAFFLVPAFFLWKKHQNSAFILNLALVYVLSAFHIFRMDAQMIMTFSWSVLAGLGVVGTIRLSDESMRKLKEEMEAALMDIEAEEEKSAEEERPAEEKNPAAEKRSEKKQRAAEKKRAAEEKKAANKKRPAEKKGSVDKKRTPEEEETAAQKRPAEDMETADWERTPEETETAGRKRTSDEKKNAKEAESSDRKRTAKEGETADKKSTPEETESSDRKQTAKERKSADKKRRAEEKESADKKRSAKKKESVDKKGSAEKKKPVEGKAETGKKEQEKPAPGKPLHNPLPVPKKKSNPQADFYFEVEEADMKFDIEVADDDDFDV